ncbi:MAG: sugar ABC transporter permease [Phycisphaerae bacterium]|nr:sugar ABC transporter permease [Phycisphaerae bacterium]
MSTNKRRNDLRSACFFLAPNFIGFLIFVAIPVVFSIAMAFTNWDLTLHNRFRDDPIQWVWLRNFYDLLTHDDFWKFLGNTLFFMMGIPLGIAGSLLLALLLTRKLRSEKRTTRWGLALIALAGFTGMGLLLSSMGYGLIALLFCVLSGVVLALGITTGATVYRTIFYLPSFTSGVAVFLLWKQMYNPGRGPVNESLRPILNWICHLVNSPQSGFWQVCCYALWVIAGAGVLYFGTVTIRSWRRRDFGLGTSFMRLLNLVLGGLILFLLGLRLKSVPPDLWQVIGYGLWAVAGLGVLYFGAVTIRGWLRRDFGFGTGFMSLLALAVGGLILFSLGLVLKSLPLWAGDKALEAPEWLIDVHWAKPALMIMGLWMAVGSNNMLLYIAGISNVPQHLYEAADIDGASSWQRFWNITWPQLAPTTFFIVIMSVIGGIQGGFEQARTMTRGGPDGATTTLSYYVYSEGFETLRMGYASSIAWVIFIIIFSLTMFNYKFGNRYVNE